MLVVDTSAVVDALAGRPPDERLLARLGGDGDLHAPHLLDDVPLVTCDRRLAAAPGHRARVELFGKG